MTKLMQFIRNDSGATAIEYGLIAAGIAVSIVAIVFVVGDELVLTFTEVDTKLKEGNGTGG